MAEHIHSKKLTPNEQIEAMRIRGEINTTRYRLELEYQKFMRTHNSGYCAFEMQKVLTRIGHYIAELDELLEDLGKVEHLDYPRLVAQLRDENPPTDWTGTDDYYHMVERGLQGR